MLAAVLAVPAAVSPATAVAATPDASTTAPAQFDVDLELRKGDDAATSRAVVDVGAEASFGFGDARQVNMTIAKSADGTKLQVKLSLLRGAKTVVKSRTIEAAAGQTQQIDLGGGTKLSLTLSPKKASHRIDLPDSDEPLAGLD